MVSPTVHCEYVEAQLLVDAFPHSGYHCTFDGKLKETHGHYVRISERLSKRSDTPTVSSSSFAHAWVRIVTTIFHIQGFAKNTLNKTEPVL